MPTLNQIQKIHDELGSANTLGSYLNALRSIDVLKCTSFVSDGHSEYYCLRNETLVSEAVHEAFAVSDKVNKKQFLATMSLAAKGKVGYIEMSKKLADSGIEGWVFDTNELTVAYISKAGDTVQKEQVKDASV